MNDWADEIAEAVNRQRHKTIGDREDSIAAALRRAKAEGMRQSVIIAADQGWQGLNIRLWSEADKIERGEA